MKLNAVLDPKNIESKINLYKNLLFSNQEFRKAIGGRWVRKMDGGNWTQWSSKDNGWMYRDDIIKREDWGRKKSLFLQAKRLIAEAVSSARRMP